MIYYERYNIMRNKNEKRKKKPLICLHAILTIIFL